MTVGELINKLSQYPKDTSILVFGDDYDCVKGGPDVEIGLNPCGKLCLTGWDRSDYDYGDDTIYADLDGIESDYNLA